MFNLGIAYGAQVGLKLRLVNRIPLDCGVAQLAVCINYWRIETKLEPRGMQSTDK